MRLVKARSFGSAIPILAVNAAQADYDNDGRLDVILDRGGWEDVLAAARQTLLDES